MRRLSIALLLLIAGCTELKQPLSHSERPYAPCRTVIACIEVIHDSVSNNWDRPNSARNGMVVIVSLQFTHDGNLLNAGIESSSGNPSFDQSAIEAIEKSSPFREFKGLNRAEFEKHFEMLNIQFMPEDLSR